MSSKIPWVIGHRGASALLPENTLESFRLAFGEHAADMIEFDVHLSADGVPVVIHDETLERTTDGQGPVADRTLAELQKFDAGFRFDPGGLASFPCRGKGIRIPSLEEVLREFQGRRLAVEIKATDPSLVAKVLQLIKTYGAEKNCIVGSLEDTVFQNILRADAPTRVFTSKKAVFRLLAESFFHPLNPRKTPKLVASLPAESRFPDLKKKNWIDWLHRKDIEVYYWTVNDPEKMRLLADRKADGIMSDNPGLIRKSLLLAS